MAIIKYLQKYPWVNSIIKMHLEKNSALLAPYHNFNHAMVITENVLRAAHYYEISEINLLCAALFHDFNHSQGALKDSANLEIAQHAFLDWWEQHNSIREIDPKIVIEIIAATEYPYVIPAAELTLEQKIIRDSDLLQYLEKNRFSQVYLGLSKEMGVPLLQLVTNAFTFINSIIPNTYWMKTQWEDGKKELFEEFEIIKKILQE